MKKRVLSLAIATIVAFTTFSFTNKEEKKEINVEKSTVAWKGYKVTGSHSGTMTLASGSLTFDEGKLTGGEFVIDMNSIKVTDMKGEGATNLEGHLKADDFFGVKNHETSKLVFTSVKSKGKNSYAIKADLTIKGITKSVTFNFSVYGSKASAGLKVDRTKYGIKYKSESFFDGLGDKTIYDEFDLNVDLQF